MEKLKSKIEAMLKNLVEEFDSLDDYDDGYFYDIDEDNVDLLMKEARIQGQIDILEELLNEM